MTVIHEINTGKVNYYCEKAIIINFWTIYFMFFFFNRWNYRKTYFISFFRIDQVFRIYYKNLPNSIVSFNIKFWGFYVDIWIWRSKWAKNFSKKRYCLCKQKIFNRLIDSINLQVLIFEWGMRMLRQLLFIE